ncbi:MAG: MAPEG family protein [Woeseia sp.]
MEPVAIVMAVALIQYLVFAYYVSAARVKHGVPAPAVSGHPEFDRSFRIHQNTLEQLVVFIPALWMFGVYVHALSGAAIGLLFPVGRYLYRKSYVTDPSMRTVGFAIGAGATLILLVGGLIGALLSWL